MAKVELTSAPSLRTARSLQPRAVHRTPLLVILRLLCVGAGLVGAVLSAGAAVANEDPVGTFTSDQLTAVARKEQTRPLVTGRGRERSSWQDAWQEFVRLALILIVVGLVYRGLVGWLLRAALLTLADRGALLSLLGSVIVTAVAIAGFVAIAVHGLSTYDPSAAHYPHQYTTYIHSVRTKFAVLYGGLVCAGGIGGYLIVYRRSMRPLAKSLLYFVAFVLFLGITLPFAETENACRLGRSLWISAHGCN